MQCLAALLSVDELMEVTAVNVHLCLKYALLKFLRIVGVLQCRCALIALLYLYLEVLSIRTVHNQVEDLRGMQFDQVVKAERKID